MLDVCDRRGEEVRIGRAAHICDENTEGSAGSGNETTHDSCKQEGHCMYGYWDLHGEGWMAILLCE